METPQQEDRAFVSVSVPVAWVEPMTYKAKNGTIYDMFALVMPQDTWLDGMDVSGYQCRLFANRYNLQQYHEQQPLITLSMRKDDHIVLRAMDEQGMKVTDSIQVDNVFAFVHVLKEQRTAYERVHQPAHERDVTTRTEVEHNVQEQQDPHPTQPAAVSEPVLPDLMHPYARAR